MTGDPTTPAPWPAGHLTGHLPRAVWSVPVRPAIPPPWDRFTGMLHAVLTGLVAGSALGTVAGVTVLTGLDFDLGEPGAAVLVLYAAVVGWVVGAALGTLLGVASGFAAALPRDLATRGGAALAYGTAWCLGGLPVTVLMPAPAWVAGQPVLFGLLCAIIGAALGATAPARCTPTHPVPHR